MLLPASTSILRGSIDTGRAIERQGVVKGLATIFDDAEAALANALNQIEHFRRLGHAERGGRLIKHDDFGVHQ